MKPEHFELLGIKKTPQQERRESGDPWPIEGKIKLLGLPCITQAAVSSSLFSINAISRSSLLRKTLRRVRVSGEGTLLSSSSTIAR